VAIIVITIVSRTCFGTLDHHFGDDADSSFDTGAYDLQQEDIGFDARLIIMHFVVLIFSKPPLNAQ
jgi:hypothetical protein